MEEEKDFRLFILTEKLYNYTNEKRWIKGDVNMEIVQIKCKTCGKDMYVIIEHVRRRCSAH